MDMTAKERAEDNRLRKAYGIGLREKRARAAEQSNQCKICGRLAAAISLAVDHDHRIEKEKLLVVGGKGNWSATSRIFGFSCFGSTRAKAVEMARHLLKRKSIRGLLCCQCNRGLGKIRRFFYDNPKFIESAAKYLREYQENIGVGKSH